MPLPNRPALCLRLTVAGLMLWASRAMVQAQEPPAGRLIFLGIAYDEGPPRGFDLNHFNYAPDNFTDLLTVQSKTLFQEIKPSALKGAQATHDRILHGLQSSRRLLEPDDLVVFYWGTHGGTTRKGWSANLPGNGIMYGRELKNELGRFPCPVLMIVSTCGSGGFVRDMADGVPVPANVVVLCACRKMQSTSNEMDRAILEALAGFGDADGDSRVTLREVVEYVPRRYAAWFPPDDDVEGDLRPVVKCGDDAPLDRALTTVRDTHVAVAKDGAWLGATLLGETSAGRRVRYLGFDTTSPRAGFFMANEVVAEEYLDLPGGFPAVEVEADGAWYPARILSRNRRQFKIHYLGYPETDDETVPASRLRYPFSAPPEMGRRRRPAP